MSYNRFFNDQQRTTNPEENVNSRRAHEHHPSHFHRPAQDYDPYQMPPDWEVARLHAVDQTPYLEIQRSSSRKRVPSN